MSTKTIAVENSVYERLAREKRSSESFTKTIERLIQSASSGTCASAVADAASVWQAIGNDADADRMEQILHLSRSTTNWEVEGPRMICIDTTVLIDEFRARGSRDAPVNRALLTYGAEILIVPACAAGEFLDGAAMVSEQRFHESLGILRRRRVVGADLETAQHYGRIVALLRRKKALAGRSQKDLWIAATARCHGARVLTRNASDFEGIPELEVLGYGEL